MNYKTFIEKKEKLPSPARLKGKILIKNKRRKEDLRPEDQAASGPGEADDEPEQSVVIGQAGTLRDEDAVRLGLSGECALFATCSHTHTHTHIHTHIHTHTLSLSLL
jgi:hypothetical protein